MPWILAAHERTTTRAGWMARCAPCVEPLDPGQIKVQRHVVAVTFADAQFAPPRAEVFNYIEMFHNPRRRHNTAGVLSPVEFERRHFQRLKI